MLLRAFCRENADFAPSPAPPKLRSTERASPLVERYKTGRKTTAAKLRRGARALEGRTSMPLSIDRRRALATISSFVAAPFLAPGVGRAAEAWPIRQVKYVNGFPAGGATDTLSRLLCQKMSELSGQSFVVENRAGAGGVLGADAVAKAPPDGYTVGLGGIANNVLAIGSYAK